jgi:hypothetical protein
MLNRASIVHVGDVTEYKMLQPTDGLASTCTAVSSEYSDGYLCERAVDESRWTDWAAQQEQVGAWITIEFDNGALADHILTTAWPVAVPHLVRFPPRCTAINYAFFAVPPLTTSSCMLPTTECMFKETRAPTHACRNRHAHT